MKKIIATFRLLQNEVIDIVSDVTEEHYKKQFHPDLSPIGWHLGHCVFTESYWIKERLLKKKVTYDTLKSLYIPELSIKKNRGGPLPKKSKMLSWAKDLQIENYTLLDLATIELASHKLLKNNFLIHFLIQHYAQHIEIIKMVLTAIQIKRNHIDFNSSKISEPNQRQKKIITVESSNYIIGLEENNLPYDNEKPPHSIRLDSFKISSLPVSNGEYLSFMNSAAYSKKEIWSDAGWEWFSNDKQAHPYHWHKHKNGYWYGVGHQGPYTLDIQQAVYGLNYFEAEAIATWAGGRLPHEYEWEVAAKNHQLEQRGAVWEWCSNEFHPYDGFFSYPYTNYSEPYFDGKHYVLKGGSKHTKTHIKRASFRNYYHADKRHIFAGCRLAYD